MYATLLAPVADKLNVFPGSTAYIFSFPATNVLPSTFNTGVGTVAANATSYNGYAVETIEDKQCIDVSRHLVTYDLAGNKIDTAEPADIEKNKPGLDCDTMYYVDIPTTGDDSVFNLKGVAGQNTNTFFMKTKVILRQMGSLTDAVYIRPSTETTKKVEFTQLELFPLD